MITPQSQAKELAGALGLKTTLYLKREDLHPYGSHKGRSIPFMINHYSGKGSKSFCISSSGNAALAAICAIDELNKEMAGKPLSLRVFVGKRIPHDKLKRMQNATTDPNITIEQVKNPKQTAFQMDKKGAAKNLRQSTDEAALAGYETLAAELTKIKNLTAVFIPTSSGAAAQGIYDGLKKRGFNAQIHIIQTPACHPMIDKPDCSADCSAANAIVDKIGHRKENVKNAIQESGGAGWIATDKDIKEAEALAKKTENLDISSNSALAIAGLTLAIKNGWNFNGPVACILTGR
jgi:threonine dehydratase